MYDIEFCKRRGAKDALDWVCTLTDANVTLKDIWHASEKCCSDLFKDVESNRNELVKIYGDSFIDRSVALINALKQVASNEDLSLAEQIEKFKISGHVSAVRWLVTVGADYAKTFDKERVLTVAAKYFTIKYGSKELDAALKRGFVDSFVREALLLIKEY